MKEIHPRHGNLSIYMNNYYCRASAATAHCPRALSIHYKSTEVILTISIDASGQEQSLVSGPVPHHQGRPAGLEVGSRRGLGQSKGHTGMTQGSKHAQPGPQASRGASALWGRGAEDLGPQHLGGRAPKVGPAAPPHCHEHPRHILRSCSTKYK